MYQIVSRLSDYIKHKKLSVRQFEKSAGMSNGSLGKAIKNGTDIQTKYLDNIIKEFPDLNPTWLLTGEGDMLLPPTANEPEPQYTKGSSSTENLVQILASPSQTGREQILKEEVLRLKQTLEEIRELHDKGIMDTLKDLLRKSDH